MMDHHRFAKAVEKRERRKARRLGLPWSPFVRRTVKSQGENFVELWDWFRGERTPPGQAE